VKVFDGFLQAIGMEYKNVFDLLYFAGGILLVSFFSVCDRIYAQFGARGHMSAKGDRLIVKI